MLYLMALKSDLVLKFYQVKEILSGKNLFVELLPGFYFYWRGSEKSGWGEMASKSIERPPSAVDLPFATYLPTITMSEGNTPR